MKNSAKNKEFLQQYVDSKLNVMAPNCDDLSDYITNFCDNDGDIEDGFLERHKVDMNDFVKTFKPTVNQIRAAIKKSSLLQNLGQKYIKAVIESIPNDIHDNIIDNDKNIIRDKMEDYEYAEIEHSALTKINSLNLSLNERRVIQNHWRTN